MGEWKGHQEGQRDCQEPGNTQSTDYPWNVGKLFCKVLLGLRHILLKNFLDWKNPVFSGCSWLFGNHQRSVGATAAEKGNRSSYGTPSELKSQLWLTQSQCHQGHSSFRGRTRRLSDPKSLISCATLGKSLCFSETQTSHQPYAWEEKIIVVTIADFPISQLSPWLCHFLCGLGQVLQFRCACLHICKMRTGVPYETELLGQLNELAQERDLNCARQLQALNKC